MAALEVIALDTATPQLRAPGASDTYTFPRAVEMPLGTANGVLFLNASKVVTSGSGLTFDGTNFTYQSAISLLNNDGSGNKALLTPFAYGGSGATGTLVLSSTYGNANQQRIRVGVGGVSAISFDIDSAEQMRLNSTGLGIGTSSPSRKLDVVSSATEVARFVRNSVGVASGGITIGNNTRIWTLYGDSGSLSFWDSTAAAERMRLDSSGNLGLGVTPSAWATNSRALQLKSYSAVFEDVVGRTTIGFNAYESASNVFTRIQTEASSLYRQVSGSHSWLTASSGAAGTTISFTQAMTLDASGRLMIGTTSPIGTLTVAGQITISGSPGGLGGSVRYIGVGGTATDWFINVPAGGSHNFAINESTKVTFNSNGDYVFGNAAIATNATNGFLYVPSCAGTPTGTPTTYTGRVPIVVDTTNNKLYFYSGGAWRDAGP